MYTYFRTDIIFVWLCRNEVERNEKEENKIEALDFNVLLENAFSQFGIGMK